MESEMKKCFFLVLFISSFNSYADEMVFECPETLYINSVILENDQPLPLNVELNTTNQPAIHLTGIDLYHNNKPLKSENKDGQNFSWEELNRFPQGLDDWIYFVCQYQNNIQLTKKVIYVSKCKGHSELSADKQYLTYADFECE